MAKNLTSLKDKWMWHYMYARKKVIMRICPNKFWHYCLGQKSIMPLQSGSEEIFKLLMDNSPCMIGRFGASEMRVVSEYQKIELGIQEKISIDSIQQLCQWSGFFPFDESLTERFAREILQAAGELDMLGVWNVAMEEYTILKYAPQTAITALSTLEPWYMASNPWSRALEGRKVLIIHPFSKTIEEQYKKREELFPGTDILPKFELHTMKAVQTIAGEKDDRFETWFDALEYMFEEAMHIDFDVAILGCGAYGFPLAAKIKQAGKKAVHLGGATQLLLGIKGKRWDDMPQISKLYNESWVRPSKDEMPQKAATVEKGCYW